MGTHAQGEREASSSRFAERERAGGREGERERGHRHRGEKGGEGELGAREI